MWSLNDTYFNKCWLYSYWDVGMSRRHKKWRSWILCFMSNFKRTMYDNFPQNYDHLSWLKNRNQTWKFNFNFTTVALNIIIMFFQKKRFLYYRIFGVIVTSCFEEALFTALTHIQISKEFLRYGIFGHVNYLQHFMMAQDNSKIIFSENIEVRRYTCISCKMCKN